MASAEQLHHLCSLLALAPCAAAAAVAAVVAAAVAAVVAAVAVVVAVAGAVAVAVAADGQVLAAVAEQQLPVGRSVLDLAFPAFQAGERLAEAATLADWSFC